MIAHALVEWTKQLASDRHREARVTKSANPYVRLLCKLYKFLARRTDSKFNKVSVAVLWHGNSKFVKGRKLVIFGVWAAPGAQETLPTGGGLRPSPFGRVSGAPGAAQTPKNYRFPILEKL